jgi:hypothetical protein
MAKRCTLANTLIQASESMGEQVVEGHEITFEGSGDNEKLKTVNKDSV